MQRKGENKKKLFIAHFGAAVYCSVLQCVAVCCSVLQCVLRISVMRMCRCSAEKGGGIKAIQSS